MNRSSRIETRPTTPPSQPCTTVYNFTQDLTLPEIPQREKSFHDYLTVCAQSLNGAKHLKGMFTTLWKRGMFGLVILACIALALAHASSRELKIEPSGPKALLADSSVPPEVRAILGRACQDCHSENTVWPWYASVPPISWQVHQDVTRGRAFMNFSKWSDYKEDQRRGYALAISTATKAGAMPPPKYLWLHPAAKLSDADVATLRTWALSQKNMGRNQVRPHP
jgi:Haem-binding domain